MSSKAITLFEAIELVSHYISKKSLPFLLNRALLCPQKKYGYVHTLRTKSSALTQISIAKFVCIVYSQPKKISKIPKVFKPYRQ